MMLYPSVNFEWKFCIPTKVNDRKPQFSQNLCKNGYNSVKILRVTSYFIWSGNQRFRESSWLLSGIKIRNYVIPKDSIGLKLTMDVEDNIRWLFWWTVR